MASIVISSTEISDITEFDNPATIVPKLGEGMRAFGAKFRELYSGVRDPDALLDSFKYVIDDLSFFVHGLSPRAAGPELLRLRDPRYNDNEDQILFDIDGRGRKFKINIRDDRKFKMNVFLPIFDDPFTYLGNIVNIVKANGDPYGKRVLLANSLISRCK